MEPSRLSVVKALGTVIAAAFVLGAGRAEAQSAGGPVEVGAQVQVLRLDELDTTDVGIGFTGAWRLLPRLTIDGTLGWFPGGGEDPTLGDQRRTLGLIGVRSGISRGRVDFYGRGRVGFLNFAEVGPFACILIFPAPLTCQLADGYTAFAFDFGGGAIVPVDSEGRWLVRLDVGDLVVRYGQQALLPNNELIDGIYSHNLLFTAGLVWRF